MPIQFPQSHWPIELLEEGPEQDPAILLSATAHIGNAAHRVLAVRVRPPAFHVDLRPDLDESVYADYSLEEMLDELNFFGSSGQFGVVPLESGSYVVWMVPWGGPLNI